MGMQGQKKEVLTKQPCDDTKQLRESIKLFFSKLFLSIAGYEHSQLLREPTEKGHDLGLPRPYDKNFIKEKIKIHFLTTP